MFKKKVTPALEEEPPGHTGHETEAQDMCLGSREGRAAWKERFHRACGAWARAFSSEDHRLLRSRWWQPRCPCGRLCQGREVALEGGAQPPGALRLCYKEPGAGLGSHPGSEHREDGVEFVL